MIEASFHEERTFSSDPSEFRGVRLWLADLARKHGFGERDAQELAVAVNEACANIHKHAYHGRIDGRIDLEVEFERMFMKLSVQDYGTTFDISEYKPPDLALPVEHGYGIFLIRECMDQVNWFRKGNGTCVVMVKGSATAWHCDTRIRRLSDDGS